MNYIQAKTKAQNNESLISEFDRHLFNEGTHSHLYEKLGAHPMVLNGRQGTFFAVWAPNARSVSVIGDFNGWVKTTHPLNCLGNSGIWEGFFTDITRGNHYKYHIMSQYNGYRVDKADPLAFLTEVPPRTASIVGDLEYKWSDINWISERQQRNGLDRPISIYEVHLGSWRRDPKDSERLLTYRELAPILAGYVKEMGFTHIELLPITEHPFYGSWGYQTTGYFAPTSRYGTPQDFMYLVDYLHQNGIGIFLDWVPSHFPADEHGLGYFDGTHLYEHADNRLGLHPEWNSLIFNYGRNEVRSFLISSALFWLDKYHIDGLRVDAVASMLYLDYSRKNGDWLPNKFGGRENLEAISLLKRFNEEVYKSFPGTQTFAEESTAWPMVSRPTYVGGLGFGLKWNMGWMHDTLEYASKDPIHRKYHQDDLTFSLIYAFNENFVLPLSHDEVVHGKGSLLSKMPGDTWQKFANLRALYGYMWGHPGKKLLFMGNEFGQWIEWNCGSSLDWHFTEFNQHKGLQKYVSDLNKFLITEPAMYQVDFEWKGFEWIDFHDADSSIISFLRRGKQENDILVFVCNFTPVPRFDYRIGVPYQGFYHEILNSDSNIYWGSNIGNLGGIPAEAVPFHNRPFSLNLTLPPLSTIVFKLHPDL
jgi:1,4-alpha-glucan branching enzyme